jgi:hypothetical protein
VIVQPGRIYRDNVELLSRLRERAPWHIEEILGHAAATVYRLEAHESLAPSPDAASPIVTQAGQ